MSQQLISLFDSRLPNPSVDVAAWIGALSFEDRCLASLIELSRAGHCPKTCIAIDYQTKVRPVRAGETKRAANRRLLHELSGSVELRPLNAYHIGPFIQQIECSVKKAQGAVVIDLTCLTKVHVMALADWFANGGSGTPSVFAYSLPERYGGPSEYLAKGGKWLEVAVSSLRFSPDSYQREAIGVVIPGHDGGRLMLALDELAVNYARVVVTEEPERPSLRSVQRVRNRWLYKEIKEGLWNRWETETVSVYNGPHLQRLGFEMADEAARQRKRLAIFPFGPKSALFAVTLGAAQRSPEDVWFSYPIPAHYDANYTSGSGSTYWASVQ
jgi:hypothetical protein